VSESTSIAGSRIPVILDTDIGTDIDDTWALAMLLKSPELDVKLVVSDSGDTWYRARVAARMLEIAGRVDVAVGVGIPLESALRCQEAWVEDYALLRYPGRVYEDGVGAIVDTIMGSSQPITLICIGPVPNVAAALARQPAIAQRARFVGMHGSIRRGYGGSPEPDPEYNVKVFPQACRQALAADWDVTITPLDTCGLVQLEGERYRAVYESQDPLVRAVIENYRVWSTTQRRVSRVDVERHSSVLFDTVAVYLAFSEDLLEMERLGIRVTDDGYTVVDDDAKAINCAMAWKDLLAFQDFLVDRLIR
jgi:inosine-uridine nucleoside N-ribohydrolase